MPETTSAAFAGAKLIGMKTIAGALAAAIGFAIFLPKTRGEFFSRVACSISSSAIFGDALYGAVHNFAPYLIEAGDWGRMPLYAIAGLPGWWLIGGFLRWFSKRDGKDIGEMYVDARKVFKDKP